MSDFNLIPSWIIVTYIVLFGLCIGSFLNVVILRGLSGEDIVFKPSKCPKCENKLKWYMNIPLISYIFLRGKCAYCKCHISVQYPVVEFITASLFTLLYLTFGFTIKTLFLAIITALFIVLATTDILETVIISYHAYILAIVGLIYCASGASGISLAESIIAGVSGFLILEIISKIGCKFTNMRIFGEGDSYILLGIGTVFGFKTIFIIMALSLLIQSIFALPMIIYSSFKEKKIKLAISYIIVFLSVIYTLLINNFNILDEKKYLISIVIMVSVLIYCLKNIFEEINLKKKLLEKELDENNEEDFKKGKNIFLLLPFGPALIISSIFCIFYLKEIKILIKNFLF